MSRNINNEPEFYVVQFMEMPFEGIDDYVCLPDTWLISSRARKEAVIVTYPTNEDPRVTRERVKRKERYNNGWKYYMAAIKYESNTYSDAEQWIAVTNDCGPLVINESEATDTQQIIPLNEKSQSSIENHSSKFNNDFWKPQPRPSIKRAAPSEPKKQLVAKQLKLDDAAQSSKVTVTDANTESKREQSIISQDNQSIECTQEEKAAAASTINESTEQSTQAQHTEQNKQALNLPVKVVNELPKVVDLSIDEENHSESIKKPNSESHLFSNTTDSRCITKKHVQLMTAEEPSIPTEQTTQPNQYNNQEHTIASRNLSSNFQSQIENVQSLANVHNDEIRNHKVSNNLKSTPLLNSLEPFLRFNNFEEQRLAATQQPAEKEMCHMNIKENVAAQKPSNLDQIASLSARLVEENQSVVSKNQSQDDGSGNSKVQIGPCGSGTVSYEESQQYVPKINTQPHNMTFVDPRNGFRSVKSHQNPYQPPNPNSFEPDILRESQGNNTCHNQEIGRIRTPSTGHNSTNPSNPFSKFIQDRLRQPQIHVDKPIASQNSTFPNQHSKRKMLENLGNLHTQLTLTSRYICEMYRVLQSSIKDTVELYNQVKALEEYNKRKS